MRFPRDGFVLKKGEKQVNKQAKRPDGLVCEDCGKQDETVHHTECPYAEEIYHEVVNVTICDYCYTQRCMDI